MSSILVPLCLATALAAASVVSASTTVVYHADTRNAPGVTLPGWYRIGGYGDQSVVVDVGENTSSGAPELFLESHQWGAAYPDEGVDTKLIGDTGVDYDPFAEYRLTFRLARVGTAGLGKPDQPFYGGLLYQVWAGHPDTGVLLAEGQATPIDNLPPSGSSPIRLQVPSGKAATGKLHIVVESRRTPELGPAGTNYQQAEISDLTLLRVDG